MSKVNVLEVMEFCSKGFVNKSQCSYDLMSARDAVAGLLNVASMFERHMTETGMSCECGEPFCKTKMLRDAISIVRGEK